MTPEELEKLAEEVHALHIARLDLPLEDLVPRPFKRRPRPNTALISDAAARITIRREIERIRAKRQETV